MPFVGTKEVGNERRMQGRERDRQRRKGAVVGKKMRVQGRGGKLKGTHPQ